LTLSGFWVIASCHSVSDKDFGFLDSQEIGDKPALKSCSNLEFRDSGIKISKIPSISQSLNSEFLNSALLHPRIWLMIR
jgi:hypothetical protein